QHHLAHIFSAIGDQIVERGVCSVKREALGIACDGTGYGYDEKIWGGEAFKIQYAKYNTQNTRIGHLENQIMIGGEIAIKEPARLLISILSKFLEKKDAYKYVKKYYSKNEFELLWNQLQQNFNCIETSSTARILDAVSVLLEFSKNESLSKHGPVDLLEKNSTIPYQIKPVVEFNEIEKMWILKTTPLFKYLIKNLHKDKKRLAATAQKYIADGLLEITRRCHPEFISGSREILKQVQHDNVFFAGGMANNKIISSILELKGVYTNKKIPRGDAGLSFGQTFYYLLTNSRD
ncbi:MAG: (NiFe) hydrogenase maturation protein HypF, partial [Candidatus Moranbacteria bacterium GW2011_GWE1_36_7]